MGHPRYHMRIDGLRQAGAECRVLAFERPTQLEQHDVGPYESLGVVEHGRYWTRVPRLVAALRKVRAAARESDVLYCCGVDLLVLARLAVLGLRRPPRLVYEIGDIRPAFVGDGLGAWIARAIERWAMRDIVRLVVTSEAFVRSYYRPLQRLGDTPFQVIEPKVDPVHAPRPPAPDPGPWDGRLHIIYYGWMCCADSWATLKQIAAEGGDRVRVDLHGIFFADLRDIEPEVEQLPNVHYHGRFQNPDDLPAMFAKCNLAWVAHHDLLANVLWARASRFFNAGHFWMPLIAQRGTEDGAVAAARDLGPVIDMADTAAAARRVLSITAEDMERWRRNLRAAPPDTFAYSTEHVEMLAALREVCGST